jgi:hypothetical protein
MSYNRISPTRRFTEPKGWQVGPTDCAFIPIPKALMPFGPTEMQTNLYEWAKLESKRIVWQKTILRSTRLPEWN